MKKLSLLLICLLLALTFTASISGAAQAPEEKVVRVGWYESAFHRTDRFGRRSGYGYEYQQRVATYTGWKYEYVEGSWSELFEMLVAGEIDLLSDVSFTEPTTSPPSTARSWASTRTAYRSSSSSTGQRSTTSTRRSSS